MLSSAFGTEMDEKDEIVAATYSGKVRSFISSSDSNTKSVLDLFGVDDKKDDEDQSTTEAESTSDSQVSKSLQTAFRGKLILFEGQFREKEIDIMFAIHPTSKMITSLSYEKLLNGQPFVSDPSRNDTEPDNLIESLTLTNVLVGI